MCNAQDSLLRQKNYLTQKVSSAEVDKSCIVQVFPKYKAGHSIFILFSFLLIIPCLFHITEKSKLKASSLIKTHTHNTLCTVKLQFSELIILFPVFVSVRYSEYLSTLSNFNLFFKILLFINVLLDQATFIIPFIIIVLNRLPLITFLTFYLLAVSTF